MKQNMVLNIINMEMMTVIAWVHRKNGKTLSATFNANDWDLSGVNVTDDFYTNALNTTNPIVDCIFRSGK